MKRRLDDQEGQQRLQFILVLGHFNCSLMYTDYFGSQLKLLSHTGILRGGGKNQISNLHSTITENMPQTTPWKHKYPLDPFLSPGFFFLDPQRLSHI